MKCLVCGATCVCRKATEMCCPCHRHKARTPMARLGRELAHGAYSSGEYGQQDVPIQSKRKQRQAELFPRGGEPNG